MTDRPSDGPSSKGGRKKRGSGRGGGRPKSFGGSKSLGGSKESGRSGKAGSSVRPLQLEPLADPRTVEVDGASWTVNLLGQSLAGFSAGMGQSPVLLHLSFTTDNQSDWASFDEYYTAASFEQVPDQSLIELIQRRISAGSPPSSVQP